MLCRSRLAKQGVNAENIELYGGLDTTERAKKMVRRLSAKGSPLMSVMTLLLIVICTAAQRRRRRIVVEPEGWRRGRSWCGCNQRPLLHHVRKERGGCKAGGGVSRYELVDAGLFNRRFMVE
jgi:hypothetical protein